ncbi:uncharacterized protein BDV14DRAFT_194414 [Aspergillus stella-maris]|uniref:uncharacterized protein n=1 Tax=Aspergillus stella-maris TaxID=1810926 RepID=UPI003CCCB99F
MTRIVILNFRCVIDLDKHDNKEIKKVVLPKTKEKYYYSLVFLELHPTARSPPDIRIYKGFLKSFSRNTKVNNFHHNFNAALAQERNFYVPQSMSTTMEEVCGKYPNWSRVQYTALMLLYYFSSAWTGEVHESTARRKIARQKSNNKDNVYKEEVPLFFNLILFMLPLFLGDHAFRDYLSFTKILDVVDSVKPKDLANTLVFKGMSKPSRNNYTGRAKGADTFGKEFAALGY